MAKLEKQERPVSATWASWCRDPLIILAIVFVFSLDQITKAVVRHSLLVGESFPSEGVFRITRTFNTGSAFGFFADQTLFLILASIVGIGILLLVYRTHGFASSPLRLSLGMQLGGALGNLVDRVRMGRVTDFLDLGFWPVFNIADASIVLGIAILVVLLLFGRRDVKPEPVPDYSEYREGDNGPYSPGQLIVSGETDNAPHERPDMPLYGDSSYLEKKDDKPCPICASSMKYVFDEWRCSVCDVKEPTKDGESW